MRACASSRPPHPARERGFSLLELLIVVTIIGIFTGVVVLSMGILGADRGAEREVTRLESLINFVHEKAVLQTVDYGLVFSEHGYQFYVYDYLKRKWVEPMDERLLAKHALDPQLTVTLRMEDRVLDFSPLPSPSPLSEDASGEKDSSAARSIDEPTPQIMILSSGQMTPFQITLAREGSTGRYQLTAGFDGELKVAKAGYGGNG